MKSVITYGANPVLSMFDDWDKIVGDFFGRDFRYRSGASGLPVVDIVEEKDRYVLEVELPGFADKDVDIKVNERMLTIASVKQEEEKTERDGVWLIRERGTRTFRRSFSMPRDVDLGAVKASFKDGLLTVSLPKRPEAQEQSITISRD